jgi:hypothetical protein
MPRDAPELHEHTPIRETPGEAASIRPEAESAIAPSSLERSRCSFGNTTFFEPWHLRNLVPSFNKNSFCAITPVIETAGPNY